MAPPNRKSDFMLFVSDWRLNHPKLSIPQAVAQCSVIWEKMSVLERKPYAEANKKPQRALSKADEEQSKRDEREEHLKRTVERIVMEGKKSQDLEKTKFLFCAFNYFTKDPDVNIYVPAEFSACEYSLKEGIISVFSTLIDPGQLNLGLGRNALDHSMDTHNLPLPPKALGERNLAKLHSQMIRYLRRNQGRSSAIVFTTTEMRPIVQSCFRFLACDGKDDFLLKILVVDIQYLFFVLKTEIRDMVGLPNDKINTHITDAVFLKDFFEFTNNIACEFHEENDRTKYCTQSMVTRWAFTFSDYMCGDMGITVEPGKHVPSTVKPKYRIHNVDTWSVTLDHGSSVESFYSLPSLKGLRINETNKSRPLRMDISAISSRCSSASAFVEGEEYDRKGKSCLNDNSDAFLPISSRSSTASIPYGATDQKGASKAEEYPRQGGYHRNSSVNKQSGSPEEIPDEISLIGSRCSGASVPYGATDQKGASKAEEYPRQGGDHRKPAVNMQRGSPEVFSDEISSISSRPYGAADQKRSSKAEEYPHQGEYHRNPSVNSKRCSFKEFIDGISPNNESASIAYGTTDQKRSSKSEEYSRQGGDHRNPSVNTQRRSPDDFSDEISPISSRRSSAFVPYGAAYQKSSSKAGEYLHQSGYHCNPSVNSKRCSFNFPDEISSNNESASIPYGTTDQKRSSKAEEYHRNPSVNRQRRSPEEIPDEISPISSRRSSASIPYGAKDQKGASKAKEYPHQGGDHRNPAVKMQLRSPDDFSDEISSIGSRRSGASVPYGATDQKGSSMAKKYHGNPSVNMQRGSPDEFSDEISSISSRPYGAANQKRSSKAEEYPRQGGYHRNPSDNKQSGSPEEIPDEISSIGSRRSGASVPYGATNEKGSSKVKEYPRQGGYHRSPLVNTQRRSSYEFPDEISPINSRRSSATDQKDSSKAHQGAYRRSPLVNTQRRSSNEFPDEISPINSPRSSASNRYGAAYQKDSSSKEDNYYYNYQRQCERLGQENNSDGEEPKYSRRYLKKLSGESFEFND